MLRKSCPWRIVFCLLAGLGSGYSSYAQDSGRSDGRGDNRGDGRSDNRGDSRNEGRGERYFKEMDRDNDGTLTEEEFNRADERMRDRLKEVGITYRRGLDLRDFARVNEKLEELRNKERESRGNDGDRRSSYGRPKEKVKINISLPASYAAIDKDRDGQIGLYEWERAKLSEFRALDRNGDGFLAPRELVAATSTTAAGKTPAKPAAATAPITDATTLPVVATPGQPSAAVPPVKAATPAATVVATPPEEDRETKQAKVFFKGLDKDSDGSISQEEWSESRGVRVKFEQANVAPTFPLSEDEFVKQYRALEQKKTTST